MGYKGLYLALLLLLFPINGGTAGAGVDTAKEVTLRPLHRDLDVPARCGSYFGYETISGTNLKRTLFNYESDGNLLFSMVAYATIVTEIDDSKTKPVVEYTSAGDVVVKISKKDYEKEKNCLPPPKPSSP